MKFTIKRSQWLRGESSHNSKLFRSSDKKMCCLGFLACALGYLKSDIYNIGGPNIMPRKDLWPSGFFSDHYGYLENSNRTYHLMRENDDRTIEDFDRELKLKSLFKDYFNIDVEFED